MNTLIHSPQKGASWVLFANFLERMAYYGFRAIFILFLVDQSENGMAWNTNNALELYGEFTAYTYLALIIGGLCADFIFGAYISTLIGLALMVFGYIGLSFVDSDTIYYSLGFIAIGAGLFKPNIPTLLTHHFKKRPEKLDSVFTGQYLAINFGAALSPLIVGYIGENIGWSVGFNIAAMIATAALVILFISKKHICSESMRLNITTKEKSQGFISGLGIVIVTSALSILFWTYYEFGYNVLYDTHSDEMSSAGYIFSSLTVILSCIIFTILWWRLTINSWFKVATGFLLFSLSWFLLSFSNSNEWNIKQIIIIAMVLHGLAEVLGQIILMPIIARMCFKPLISTSFSIHMFTSSIANHLVSYLSGGNSTLKFFGWVCLAVGLSLIVIQIAYNQYKTKQNKLAI